MKKHQNEFDELVRRLVKKMIAEGAAAGDDWIANDDESPLKKAHADPSGSKWDVGLDEADLTDGGLDKSADDDDELDEAINMRGSIDGATPKRYTNEQLSRISDIIELDGKISEVGLRIWQKLPRELKLEFNYSRWKYVPR